MEKACTNNARDHRPAPGSRRLSQLGIGCKGCVVSVGGDHDLRRRLLELGFCNGVQVEVIRRAPLGDPIEFRLRGYHLSLRNEQARHVTITTE
ncbi:MAG: FeoA family protein [Tepidisphaeraceae bacterium]